MQLCWQFVKRNGFTLSFALKVAWANIKLKAQMKMKIVKFYFKKVDGTLREAYDTLSERLLPKVQSTGRKANDTIQVYYDTERCEFRSYKKANLVVID